MYAHWEYRLLDLAGCAPQPARSRPAERLEDDRLRSAYAACDALTAEHSKSFYLASGLLPGAMRPAVRALYAFCRTVDDIVDRSGDPDREGKLDYWRGVVRGGSFPASDLVAAAWADTLTRFEIPRLYALQLIDGVARDLTQTRYRTFDELAQYCYGVASTVGLMSMYIVGFQSSDAVPYAIRLGVALQLTNVLRDVAEDYRNGRVYLPQEELAHFGLGEDDLVSGHLSPRWIAFMRFQIERARSLYAESWPGVGLLAREGRLAIGAASTFYSRILDDIEQHGYDVFSRRAHLGAWEKLRLIPSLWFKVSLL
jgi:phytoene synthase